MVDESLISQLRGVLLAGPELQLAVLFGSVARGQARPDSDLDIGIGPSDPDLRLHDELDLQVELERVAKRPVDLVRLDRAPVLLRYRVARDGVALLGARTGAWARFAGRAASEHAELAPALGHAAKLYARRVAEGAG